MDLSKPWQCLEKDGLWKTREAMEEIKEDSIHSHMLLNNWDRNSQLEMFQLKMQ
jgi:hypothetical protein